MKVDIFSLYVIVLMKMGPIGVALLGGVWLCWSRRDLVGGSVSSGVGFDIVEV